jgi:hypothetical protein
MPDSKAFAEAAAAQLIKKGEIAEVYQRANGSWGVRTAQSYKWAWGSTVTGSGNKVVIDEDKDKNKDTKAKDTYDLDEEIDKYYEVNRELKKLQKAREKLSKQTEHLVGQDLIDNLTK